MIFENGPVRSGLRPNKNPLDTFPCPRVHIHGSTLIFTHLSLNAGYGAISHPSLCCNTYPDIPDAAQDWYSSIFGMRPFHQPACSLDTSHWLLLPSMPLLLIAILDYITWLWFVKTGLQGFLFPYKIVPRIFIHNSTLILRPSVDNIYFPLHFC